MVGFSILICAYNPQEIAFKRLIQRIRDWHIDPSIPYEVILIDNKSVEPLSRRSYVQAFLEANPRVRCVVEEQPGLTPARLRGIQESTYEWLIFLDDDNEPALDYINRAAQFVRSADAASVGAFGPGTICVEYLTPVAPWLNDVKDLFQERSMSSSVFGSARAWQHYYPAGTGMVIRKELAELYATRVINGNYTLTDRKGKSLSSGGDVQMVFTAIQQGYSVGALEGLSLNHLIDSYKSNIQYLKRLEYGTASAYIKAYNQVYTDAPIPTGIIRNKQVFMRLYSLLRIYYTRVSKPKFALLLCSKMGEYKAMIESHPQRTPWVLRLLEKWIHGL
jgi:glycosyltransferase involved in cell wall biosynthesis